MIETRSGKGNRVASKVQSEYVKLINKQSRTYRTTVHNVMLTYFLLLIDEMTG